MDSLHKTGTATNETMRQAGTVLLVSDLIQVEPSPLSQSHFILVLFDDILFCLF